MLKAQSDSTDDDYWDEQELGQMECNLINMIEQEWFELDCADVSLYI